MVQRKVPNKIGIKPLLLKLDAHLVPSSQTYEKLKKIMKNSRPVKRPDESWSFPACRKKKTPPLHAHQPGSAPATPQKQSPNYMKSTSSFEARKEQSHKSPTSKGSRILKTNEPASGVKGSRTSSAKMVRTLTKTPSFKPLRSSRKVILCEDVDAQRATCSSTLKESKFPSYLQLNPGGDELDGTSAMKVCPYTYCSLNGRPHAPAPPLKCFLSARRRALKTQKGLKLACLSPRHFKPVLKKEPVILDPEEGYMKEENRDFFVDIYSKDKESKGGGDLDLERSDIDWEEGYSSDSGNDGFKLPEVDGGVAGYQIGKTGVERLYNEHQELYDEESVSSEAWSEEDGDSASHSSCRRMKTNQDYPKYDEFEESSTTAASDINDKMDEFHGPYLLVEDQNSHDPEKETSHASKTVPDFAEKSKDETDKNHTTIIYNIIQFNISVFINGEKTEHLETDKTVTVQVPATSVAAGNTEAEEAMEEQRTNMEDDEANEVNRFVTEEELPFNIASTEQLDETENQDNPEQKCNEYEACGQPPDSLDEEPATRSDVADEITSERDIKATASYKKIAPNDELPNLRELTGCKKPGQEFGDDSREFNPRGPNFLPETPDPDAETVDLRHQMIDERKNAEEWMVDVALQQAVTTLAPARKRKVALLVEAFEKVMPAPVPVPIPMYEAHNRHTSKAFTNSRPMQACS